MRRTTPYLALLAVGLGALLALSGARGQSGGEPVVPLPVGKQPGHVGHGTPLHADEGRQLAIFAQGCFWGAEYRFRKVPGVVATAVGYTGGTVNAPSYEEVSSHGSGHAESVLVEFDPKKVSYQALLEIFWNSHDPTTRDRQGPDSGSQYRSAIFTFTPEQLRAALASRDSEQQRLVQPITTEIRMAEPFWIAEAYHQQWDERHGRESCPLPRHAARK
jgi:peptide-methionine (S)-S-oxide reductase